MGRTIGLIAQDVQLFQASVRDNLTLFDCGIPDERLLEAIEELELKDWYESLPEGLDTRLETSGQGFSAGEAQLLAFTRAFLRDPGLVILDEASSRLDPATEQRIERAVDKLLCDRTAIEHGEREWLAADPTSRFYSLLQTGMEEMLA